MHVHTCVRTHMLFFRFVYGHLTLRVSRAGSSHEDEWKKELNSIYMNYSYVGINIHCLIHYLTLSSEYN